jgi:probable HAF family extracellular repeat protein
VGCAESPTISDSSWEYAFLYIGGAMTDLVTLAGLPYSCAYGINNRGQVVGWAESGLGQGYSHAFLYSGGTITDLGTLPGGPLTYGISGAPIPYGINDSGQVVGSANFGYNEAFLYSGGTMLDLNNLVTLPSGVYLTNAAAINDRGQIAALGSDNHAYL